VAVFAAASRTIVRCPTLAELPEPPAGQTGWPWTEQSRQLSALRTGGDPWPRITIVTPSFNQGRFLEETIRSILLQGYPNLEYFVLDGGSSDHSVDIIRKYSEWIDFWTSEPDRGQSAAINRGLRMGSGSHAAWINSDDKLCQDALYTHMSRHELADDVVYVGDCLNIDEEGTVLSQHRGRVHTFDDLLRLRSVWRGGGYICQQEVLFPLSLAMRVGGLNEDNHYSMDYELWGRFFLEGATLHYTGIPFGMFRYHAAQKTKNHMEQTRSTLETAASLIALAKSLSPEVKHELLTDLQAYGEEYPKIAWKYSGRLARLGLPSSVVTPIRQVRQTVEQTITSFIRSTK